MKVLRSYQKYAAELMLQKHLLLCDEPGLGKTIQAITAAQQLMIERQAPVLVIAPKSLIINSRQWEYEIKEQSDRPILVIDSTFEFNGRLIGTKPYWVLTYYEAVVKYQNILSQTLFAAVILDEAHRIKNRKALRTKAVKRMQGLRRVELTATPINRDPSEYWSLLNFLEPRVFTSYWKFRNAHIQVETDRFGYEHVTGVKNPAQFAKVLSPFMLRRTKLDVAPEMPQKIIQIVPIELNPDQRKLYNQIEEVDDQVVSFADLNGELTQLQIKIVLTQILRLQQVSNNPKLLNSPASSAKLEWLIDWLDDNPDQSVIIFTKFRDTAKQIYTTCGCDCLITGEGIIGQPQAAQRIVGTIAKMGEGLDLPHISTAIFLDREWSSIMMKQAIDRIDRLGIKEAKLIYYLEAIDTVDLDIRKVNDGNVSLAEMIHSYCARLKDKV